MNYQKIFVVAVYNKFADGYSLEAIADYFELTIDDVDDMITEALILTGMI